MTEVEAGAPTESGLGQTLRRVIAALADGALWVGSVLGACALLLILLGLVLGIRPLIFRSGSMAPTIPAGSLGLSREVAATSVHRGDVVTVPADGGSYVTHRVVALRQQAGVVELRLRGDANNAVDQQIYRVQTVDRLLFSVPGLGYPIAWLSQPPGIFVLAGYVAVMLAIIFRRQEKPDAGSGDDHSHNADPSGREKSSSATIAARHLTRSMTSPRSRAAFAVLLLGSALALRPEASWATLTDKVDVTGSTLGTYAVPATTLSCGALGALSVTFNWTAVTSATDYTLHYGSNGSQTMTTKKTTYTFLTAITGGSAWVTVNQNLGSMTWTADSNRVTYTVAVISLCSSG